MLRGTSIFICDNCGHIFKALDIEYNCTALSAPQKCPKCGSYHTMPMDDLDFPRKTIYEGIWHTCEESERVWRVKQPRPHEGIQEEIKKWLLKLQGEVNWRFR